MLSKSQSELKRDLEYKLDQIIHSNPLGNLYHCHFVAGYIKALKNIAETHKLGELDE